VPIADIEEQGAQAGGSAAGNGHLFIGPTCATTPIKYLKYLRILVEAPGLEPGTPVPQIADEIDSTKVLCKRPHFLVIQSQWVSDPFANAFR
jgi:hypothetical protein